MEGWVGDKEDDNKLFDLCVVGERCEGGGGGDGEEQKGGGGTR